MIWHRMKAGRVSRAQWPASDGLYRFARAVNVGGYGAHFEHSLLGLVSMVKVVAA